MIGLLKKDYYLGRRFIFLGIAVFFLITGLFWLVRFSFIYGNPAMLALEDIQYGIDTTDLALFSVPGLLLMFFSVQTTTVSVFADARAGWNQFLFTGTIPVHKIVLIKYAEFLVMECTVFMLSLLSSLIYGWTFGFANMKEGLSYLFLELFIVTICQCLILPLAYRYKNENAVTGRVFLILTLMSFMLTNVLGLYIGKGDEMYLSDEIFNFITKWPKKHFAIAVITGICLMAAALVISFFSSVQIVRRRERLCGDSC